MYVSVSVSVCTRTHLVHYAYMCVRQKVVYTKALIFIEASVVFRTAVVNLLRNQCTCVCKYVVNAHATYTQSQVV